LDGLSVGLPWPVVAWLVAGTLVLAGAVAVDARERGQSAPLWFLLAVVFPIYGALAYVVLRGPREEAVRGGARPASESTGSAREAPPATPREAAAPVRMPPGAPPAGEATPRAATASSPTPASGGATEWRRDVGVLPTAPGLEHLGVTAVPPRHASRERRRVAPWLVGGLLALVVLVAGGSLLWSRVGPSIGGPSAAPSPTPPPTAEPTAAPEAAQAPDTAPAEAAREPLAYTVEPGDTLGSIADQFNTSMDALMQANNLDDPDLLVVGQRLIVPQ
jgi:LysM repeat protein